MTESLNISKATESPQFKVDRTITDDDGLKKKFQFSIVIGETSFQSPWWFGDDEQIEDKRLELMDALAILPADIEINY